MSGGSTSKRRRKLSSIRPAIRGASGSPNPPTVSHHGVGIARLPWIRAALGDSAGALDRVKAALDPAGVLNPGKLGLAPPPQR